MSDINISEVSMNDNATQLQDSTQVQNSSLQNAGALSGVSRTDIPESVLDGIKNLKEKFEVIKKDPSLLENEEFYCKFLDTLETLHETGRGFLDSLINVVDQNKRDYNFFGSFHELSTEEVPVNKDLNFILNAVGGFIYWSHMLGGGDAQQLMTCLEPSINQVLKQPSLEGTTSVEASLFNLRKVFEFAMDDRALSSSIFLRQILGNEITTIIRADTPEVNQLKDSLEDAGFIKSYGGSTPDLLIVNDKALKGSMINQAKRSIVENQIMPILDRY